MIIHKKNTRGFSLVEISIVLVIIGIIFGGVLTGQQVMQNARISNAVTALQAYQAQLQTYTQNFGALPGDDGSAGTRFASLSVGQCSGTTCGDGEIGTNASFDAPKDATGAAAESRLVWAHLRAANLVKNQISDSSTAVQPANPFGGVYGFQNGTSDQTFTTTILCLDKVPAAAAQGIDSRLDDGDKNGGLMHAISGGAAGDTTYNQNQIYTLCIRI